MALNAFNVNVSHDATKAPTSSAAEAQSPFNLKFSFLRFFPPQTLIRLIHFLGFRCEAENSPLLP